MIYEGDIEDSKRIFVYFLNLAITEGWEE